MMYFDKFIEFFNAECVVGKELEFKFLLDPRSDYPKFIKLPSVDNAINDLQSIFANLLPLGVEIKQTINFISNRENYSCDIKELHFDNGVQNKGAKRCYNKTIAHAPIYINGPRFDLKVGFNIETPLETEPIDFDLIRYKFRFTFTVANWHIDFTFIKVCESKEASFIKGIKERFFCSDINESNIIASDWIWRYADKIELEFEFDNKSDFRIGFVNDIYDFVSISNQNDDHNILHKLYCCVENQDPENTRRNNKDTLKKILPNVIEINKKQYFSEILHEIDRYYITDKADGIRTILILDKDHCAYYNTSYVAVSVLFSLCETIIECEKVGDIFYAYDILQYNGINVSKATFEKRLYYLQRVKWAQLCVKQFTKLTKEAYQTQIRNFYDNALTRPYHIDGLIFTSCNTPYKTTQFYKWKPVEDMTIDFVARKCPKELMGINPYNIRSGYSIYILFNGISYRDYKKLGLGRIQYYNKLFSYTNKNYFPIQFSPSDKPNAYIWYHQDDTLDGKVVELCFDGEWRLNKIREDRSADLEKSYYGNNFKVAEIIWRNFSNPLTMDMLCSTFEELSKEFYFITEHSTEHKSIRKFNNMVKFELIKRLSIDKSTVIDFGCGKGQDMFKYVKSGISSVLMIDVNENNLCEIISRKYGFCDNNSFNKDSMNIYIQNLDLTRNYLDNLMKLYESGIPITKNSTKLIICNFAIHYLCETPHQIANLVNMVDALLGSGGRFLFTCLDGQKVYDLLKDEPEWGDGAKYKIKKLYGNGKFDTGKYIDILLPFSNGTFYREALVNLEAIKKQFEKKKIMMESSDTFEHYLRMFQDTHHSYNLDEWDLVYIKLLNFTVLYKH